MASVAPIILKRRRDVLTHFLSANAVSRDSAVTYEPERFIDGRLLQRMLDSGVVVATTPGHYYVDIPAYDADNRRRRRWVGLLTLALVVVIAAIAYTGGTNPIGS